jgi:hypothetical protein
LPLTWVCRRTPDPAIGLPCTGLFFAGRGRKDAQAERLRVQQASGRGVYLRSLPQRANVRGPGHQLYNDYKDKGVAVVAISPNDPKAIRIDELDSSDVSDTLDEMKIRVAYKHLEYPYLYDGDTESVSQAYGPQASPHIFIFDQQRKLRYEGAIDDSYRVEFVKRHYALDAINALLADKEVAVKHTGAFGCSTKWSDKEAANVAFMEKLNAQPISLDMVSAER